MVNSYQTFLIFIFFFRHMHFDSVYMIFREHVYMGTTYFKEKIMSCIKCWIKYPLILYLVGILMLIRFYG